MLRWSRTLIAAAMATVLTIGASAPPVAAYNKYPGGRYANSSVSDSEISVCFGVNTDEGVYYHRFRILDALENGWGSAIGFWPTSSLNFYSNGICNNDGSELRILWDRSMSCGSGPTYGYIHPNNGPNFWATWTSATIYLNADCEINGTFDWTLSDGIGAYRMSALWTVTHEFGHALGLDHSQHNWALMWGGVSTHDCGGLGNHAFLSTDDHAGAESVYSPYFSMWTGGTSQWPTCQG